MQAPVNFARTDSLSHRVVTAVIRYLLDIICDIDASPIDKIPSAGPLILASNHINFLDAPLIYTQLMPRKLTALIKHETWNNPILGYLFTLWGGVPIRRGEMDLSAIRMSKRALELGYILAVAPEGTRSGNGILQKGYSGISVLALHNRVPIIPMAIVGCENFWNNIRRFRRTKVRIMVGEAFYLDQSTKHPDRDMREAITDMIMCRIALLLPVEQRGVYRDCSL